MNDEREFPPDWYKDPEGPSLRYWDGERWTDQRAPLPPEPREQRSSCGLLVLIIVGVFVAIAIARGCATASGVLVI